MLGSDPFFVDQKLVLLDEGIHKKKQTKTNIYTYFFMNQSLYINKYVHVVVLSGFVQSKYVLTYSITTKVIPKMQPT